jgi:hypothetical protein
MRALFFRFSALALRFGCPLAALVLSNAETMGKFYLFISFFTFVVGVSALELAVPFSRKFLRCKSDKQRRLIFSGFLSNQVLVTTVLAFPAGVFVSSWAGVPAVLIPLFCLSLATEACVNEVGRLFWNIGEWRIPSLRDFIRAVIFTVAIVGSVYFENEVLTAMTFLIIATGNLCILCWEWKSWGIVRLPSRYHSTRMIRSAWNRGSRSLKGALPQYVHMQLLGLQPLLERILVESTLGLAAVGSFSFLTSVMQSAAGLLLVPLVARYRQHILRIRLNEDIIATRIQTLGLLFNIFVICSIFACAVYYAFPLLNSTLGKDLKFSFALVFAAYISSISAIFCSAVAPMFTVKGLALRVNVLTTLAMTCFALAQYINGDEKMLLLLICIIATLQITGRLLYILKQAHTPLLK